MSSYLPKPDLFQLGIEYQQALNRIEKTYVNEIKFLREELRLAQKQIGLQEELISMLEQQVKLEKRDAFTQNRVDIAVRLGYLAALAWSEQNVRNMFGSEICPTDTTEDRIKTAVSAFFEMKRDGEI